MYQIILKPKAIEMAKEAYDWYELERSGLGDLFMDELESCYEKLEGWPTAYTKIKKNFRQIGLNNISLCTGI